MSSFRVVPISSEVAEQVRNTRKSPIYGFPAHREVRLIEKGEPIGAPAMDEAEMQPAIG